jgi:hypothetical protein
LKIDNKFVFLILKSINFRKYFSGQAISFTALIAMSALRELTNMQINNISDISARVGTIL